LAQYFSLHPHNPQLRLLKQAAAIIEKGGIAAIPTDSSYALVAHLDDKLAAERLRRIRDLDEKHHLTLLCRDLSAIANYAKVDNRQYRMLKAATPGAFTFILEASREVPRRLSHPSRKTIGLRWPKHEVTQALLEQFGQPLLSATLHLPDDDQPLNDPEAIRERLEHQVDVIIDSGACSLEPTTVVDLTGEVPQLLRRGGGDPAALGLIESGYVS
jgi:tRNA threonylcarbamoyl adenosine modification protein (Sua5/YciO/YrdC/YwlC family)